VGEPLIRLELAQARVQLVQMTPEGKPVDLPLLDAAITDLKKVAMLEPKNTGVYRLLAIAYGRRGDMPMAHLFQAEEWLALGEGKKAKERAEQALAGLPMGSPGWLRAQDIEFAADQRDDDGYELAEPVTQAAL